MSFVIELEAPEYAPGSVLRGRVISTPLPGHEEREVELSVLWQTEGKGDTDLGVAFHRKLPGGEGVHELEVRLPLLPVSYDGTLLKIRWLVRARRLAALGDDSIEERELVVRWP